MLDLVAGSTGTSCERVRAGAGDAGRAIARELSENFDIGNSRHWYVRDGELDEA